ncbi:MAG TPA: ABC transporter ATP-binding protein [Oceanospirillaceae bacterium]|nr:ABC transporter ATP-binding protein [Oceanospirillaceae bacterium]
MTSQLSSLSSTSHLQLRDVCLAYGERQVVQHVDIDIGAQEIICLLGPSGCGKSTLLRAIAGFQPLAAGSICLADQVLAGGGTDVAPEQRHIGMVFQDVALFPHLTIAHNIAFGLQGWSRAERHARVDELLALVELDGYGVRYPHELSGGQQQRVALARAMAPRPKLLLMDEPFSGLDAMLREELVPQVAAVLKREGMAAILVTHDQNEAFAMADRIGVMRHGRIEQWNTAYNIYHRPATKFVADFIGEGDFLDATVVDNATLSSSLGDLRGPCDGYEAGNQVQVFIRPDDVLHDDKSALQGRIVSKRFRGTHFLYRVAMADGQQLSCFADSHHDHQIGENIGIKLNLDHLMLFA